MAKFKSTADIWRLNKCHRFSKGPPTNKQAKFFLSKLLRSSIREERFIITDPDEVYVEPTEPEEKSSKAWLLENNDNFIGMESGLPISLLSNTWNMLSFDRSDSKMDSTAAPQGVQFIIIHGANAF